MRRQITAEGKKRKGLASLCSSERVATHFSLDTALTYSTKKKRKIVVALSNEFPWRVNCSIFFSQFIQQKFNSGLAQCAACLGGSDLIIMMTKAALAF